MISLYTFCCSLSPPPPAVHFACVLVSCVMTFKCNELRLHHTEKNMSFKTHFPFLPPYQNSLTLCLPLQYALAG